MEDDLAAFIIKKIGGGDVIFLVIGVAMLIYASHSSLTIGVS